MGYSGSTSNIGSFSSGNGGGAISGGTVVTTINQAVPIPVPQPYPVTITRRVPVPVAQPVAVPVPRPVPVSNTNRSFYLCSYVLSFLISTICIYIRTYNLISFQIFYFWLFLSL